jgi:hypothetical protein
MWLYKNPTDDVIRVPNQPYLQMHSFAAMQEEGELTREEA